VEADDRQGNRGDVRGRGLRLLLDTAVFIFAAQAPERISKRAAAALTSPENVRQLSAVSLTEISIKAALGKLHMSAFDVRAALDDLVVGILPFTANHAFRLFEFAPKHGDPFDRLIIAQAMVEQIPVVTPDDKFRLYKGLKLIW
jgi:PIN domain nuclease of toxin-antitoxin system